MRHSLWLRGKQGVDYCQQVCLLLSTVRAAVVNRAVDSSQQPVFVVRKNNSPYGKTSFSPVLLLYKLPGKGCFAIGRQLYRPVVDEIGRFVDFICGCSRYALLLMWIEVCRDSL